jgi:ubiquinone/menaquinone biosynthesis C-methylase UbiE
MTETGFQLAQRQARLYESQSGVFMGPSGELMVEALGLQPGDSVLDLACGTGLVARHAWAAVAPGGRVVGADLNPAMLAVAESIVSEPEIEWLEAGADSLPLESAAFTHVVCQQGLQFFPDAPAAVRETHRVLRPGGLFLATIWATPGHNPYIDTQLALLSELDASVAASARAATPAHADDLLTVLAANAGFAEIEVSLLEHTVEVADVESFFLDQTSSTPWATVTAALSPPERAVLAATFASRLNADRTAGGGHLLRFGSYQLSARR